MNFFISTPRLAAIQLAIRCIP